MEIPAYISGNQNPVLKWNKPGVGGAYERPAAIITHAKQLPLLAKS